MQKKYYKNILLLIGLLMLSAINNNLNAQNCCCDDISEVEVPGGDFEIPPPPANGGWIDYSLGEFLGPWEIITGSVSHHDDDHNNLGAGNPNPSTAHLDLNGFSVGTVCQDISGFVIGQEYQLVFYYAIHNALANASATVEIGGGIALSETWNATNLGNIIWLEASYNFIATTETMDLCFYSNTAVNCCGMLIDDIKILVICTEDIELPEIVAMPPDATYNCIEDVPEPIDIQALDNCSIDLSIVFYEEFSSNNFCEVVILRTWTVEDDCGNIATYTQIIFVIDLDPPEIAQPLSNLTVTCDEDAEDLFLDWIGNFGGGIIFDECSDFYSLTNYQITDFDECSENEVTFTFGDFCGNEIYETVYFNIVDNEAPVFDSLPQNLNIPCGDDAQVLIANWLTENAYADVSDNCSYSLVNDFSGNYNASQTVTFTATDLCGNQVSSDAEITIITDVEIIQIDTFTCDPDQAGLIEILIDNEFCDSLIMLDFILLASDTLRVEANTCNMLAAGLDTLFLTNFSNCDSLVITNTTYTSGDTLYNSVTTCDDSQVGTDTLFLLNTNNCDSLVVINTIYTAGDTLYSILTTCDDSQVGTDTLFFFNTNNCDSLVVINTIYTAGDTLYNVITTCDDSQVGTDTLFFLNTNNCDSLVVINTIYTAGDTLYNVIPTCDESQVAIDTQYLLNQNDCDSLVVTSIYFSQNDTLLITQYSCDIDQAEYNTIIISGPVCDTIVLMEFLPLASDSTTLEMSTCKLSEMGVFTENLTNLAGCDSVVISNYNYVPTDTLYVNSETCLLTEVIQDTIMITTGDCDSTIVYSTVLLEGNLTTIETFTCDSVDAQYDTIFYQNLSGCDSLVIIEYYYNAIEFDLIQNNDPCTDNLNGSLEIINLQGSTQPYLFSLDGNDFSEQSHYSSLDSGTYIIYAQDINGCISEPVEVTIDFHTPIEVSLPSNVLITLGTAHRILVEFSVKPDTFYWSDENLVSCTSCLDPFIMADQDVELTLYYMDEYGCLFSEIIIITVVEEISDFFIPNVFSPNGDNTNEFFQIFTNDPFAKLELCEIYDRWGNRFYQNIESDIMELKWDGRLNGRDAATGIYVYRIVIIDGNGDSIRFVGDVTLLR